MSLRGGKANCEKSPIVKAYGIMGFKGTAEEAEYFAVDPDFLPGECRTASGMDASDR